MLLYNQALPLIDIYLRESETTFYRDKYSSMFTVTLLILAKLWSQPRYFSIDEGVKKMWHTYIAECFSAINNKMFSFAKKNG